MARFDSGWFKFYRRAFFEDIGRNQTCLALWSALLSMANYKETKIIWEGKQRTLPPGSIVLGVAELAEKWRVSRPVIAKWLRYLALSDRIVVESCARGTLVTILNWELYQGSENGACEQRVNNVTATCEQRDSNETLSEEHKKEERRKKDKHAQGAAVQSLIADYCERWKSRYGVNPTITKADAGRMGRLIKSLGSEKAAHYLGEFFASDDANARFTSHSVACFENSINKLKARIEGGMLPLETRRKTKAEEVSDYNAEMHRKILAGEV